MKRPFTAFTVVCLATLLAQAHEFWLQPSLFFTKQGDIVSIEVLVGEHSDGERSEGKKDRIVQYTHRVTGTKEDLAPQFQILFEHKPLPNVLVRYWTSPVSTVKELPDVKPKGLTEEQQPSDAQGRVRFQLRAGQNMVSLVQMIPTTDANEAYWQSYWGSLTFGFR